MELVGVDGSVEVETDGSGAATVGLDASPWGSRSPEPTAPDQFDSVTVTVGLAVGSAVGSTFAGAGSLTCPMVVP